MIDLLTGPVGLPLVSQADRPARRASADGAALRTVLVSAPFADWRRPSIQLGLLAALARQHGHRVETRHLLLDLVPMIGVADYDRLAQHRGPMIGDWLFALEAFGAEAPDQDGTLPDRLAAELGAEFAARLQEIRREVIPRYLDAVCAAGEWAGVDVVGFTSTFQQTVASVAIARRLRAAYPRLVTIFGGANLDGVMGPELVRSIPEIDYGISGEADVAFPALLTALAEGTDVDHVPAVIHRTAAGVAATAAAPMAVLGTRPDPDYDEYFARGRHLGVIDQKRRAGTRLPFESARGCWWGAKHHCTFCGLNGTTMTFRARPPDEVLGELARQSQRHGTFQFFAVDNILDHTYLESVLPKLRDDGLGYDLFYEIKANLTRSQIRLLADAGVHSVQPGLESLSSGVLALMRKGVRMIQNVNTLRWAAYYGVDLQWNLLYGFPGETADQYAEQTAIMPALHHLQPAGGTGRVWLERFSPLYADAVEQGATLVPEGTYADVYPTRMDLAALAYFFQTPPELDTDVPAATYAAYAAAAQRWSAAWRTHPRPTLTVRSAPGYAIVEDRRDSADERAHHLRGPLAAVHDACLDRPTGAAAIARTTDLPAGVVESALAELAARRLVVRDGSLALALALPAIPGR